MDVPVDSSEWAFRRALAARYPTADLALAEAAALRASLLLPKGVVHVVSDVHGEYKKLRHIINNASGSLRPLVESLFAEEMSAEDVQKLLAVIYYPHEACEHVRPTLADAAARGGWVGTPLRALCLAAAALAASGGLADVRELIPPARRELFEELLFEPAAGRG